MENNAWVLLISMIGGVVILLWFLYKPEKKCSQCGRPLKSNSSPGILNDCNICGCSGENLKES